MLVLAAWFGAREWMVHREYGAFAAEFDQYLTEIKKDPQAAPQILLARYYGQQVDAEQAVLWLGHRPAVFDGLPTGYSGTATYVMKMPCCTRVQTICHRADGTAIAIFEHEDEEPERFGDRPQISAVFGSNRCTRVDLDEQLAADWQHGNRHITLIGARDTAEVGELAAWLSND